MFRYFFKLFYIRKNVENSILFNKILRVIVECLVNWYLLTSKHFVSMFFLFQQYLLWLFLMILSAWWFMKSTDILKCVWWLRYTIFSVFFIKGACMWGCQWNFMYVFQILFHKLKFALILIFNHSSTDITLIANSVSWHL